MRIRGARRRRVVRPALILFSLAAAGSTADAADLWVDATGSDLGNNCQVQAQPCRSLQHAVDSAAPAGDLIHVVAGIYDENVVIARSLSVIGAGPARSRVNGRGIGSALQVMPGNTVSLSGLAFTNGGSTDGGGISNAGTLTLDDVELSGSVTSIFAGGGLFNAGTVTGTRVHIEGNEANQGGGICDYFDASTTLVDSTVVGNTGSQGGGYLAAGRSRLDLDRTEVRDNRATDTGGGLFLATSCILRMRRSTVAGNSAANLVGGILSVGDVELSDSTVSGNRADFLDGGGIYHGEGTLALTNVTVSGNACPGDGGGLHLNTGIVTLNLVTVADNTARNGGGLYARSSATVHVSHILVAGNSASTAASDCNGVLDSQGYNLVRDPMGCALTGNTTGNQTGVDPLLGPLLANGGPTATHALLAGSPAIDAGAATCGTTADQRGEPRPTDGTCGGPAGCDIGAFEAAGCAALPHVFESPSRDMAGATDLGVAAPNPFAHNPPIAPRLYYTVDDGAGNPPLIRITRAGAGIQIYF